MARSDRDDNEKGGGAAPPPYVPPPVVPVVPPTPPTYTAPDTPSWWSGALGKSDIESTSNALLPYLAPEDTKLTTEWLARNNPSVYGGLLNTPLPKAPSTYGTEDKASLLSRQRAQNALSSLENMRKLTGRTMESMGPGYMFLTRAIDLLNQFGGSGENRMSRSDYGKYQLLTNQMLTEAKGTTALSDYGSLLSAFAFPTGRKLQPTHVTSAGTTVPGAASGKLFV